MEDNKRNQMLRQMLEGRGFYIVLLLCLLTVGATGLVMAKDGRELKEAQTQLEQQAQVLAPSVVPQEEEPEPVQQEQPQQTEPEAQTLQEQQSVQEQQPVQEQEQPQQTETAAQPEEQPEAQSVMGQEENNRLYAPLTGAVQRAYSGQSLQYDKTMGDYRSHGGTDLNAPLGTQVMAAGDGQVTSVYNDDRLGMTVVVDHGNGLQTLYANLGEVSVVPGDIVKTGDILAVTGTSARAEQAQEPHLHLEVINSGLREDPAQHIIFGE